METVEGLLSAAVELGDELGVRNLPLIVAWTSRYPGRAQMREATASGDPVLGTRMMLALLDVFTGPDSPYRHIRVLPHLDHAYPWLDGDILDGFMDQFASVMVDASEKPLEENMALTARYVERAAGRVVVEGAVDAVYEAGSGAKRNQLTTAAQAELFIRRTGVDLIVPNLGTEHRSTRDKVRFSADRAGEIRDAVGSVQVLHGTSSLHLEDLSRLPELGVIKANVFTALAKAGGQAVARQVLADLNDLLESPSLAKLCNPPRRRAWTEAVREQATTYLRAFHYPRFAGQGGAA
jgi:fructose-bisphosphate aldolase class II